MTYGARLGVSRRASVTEWGCDCVVKTAFDSRVRELVTLARDRDRQDRTVLFRHLVKLFLDGNAPSREEPRDRLLEIVDALIPHVEIAARRTAADQLLAAQDPPLDLAEQFALDEIQVAEPLLRHMPFTHEQLIDIIGRTRRSHHQAIATRGDLSIRHWIALARAKSDAGEPASPFSSADLWRDDLGEPKAEGGHPVEQREEHPMSVPSAEHPAEPRPTPGEPAPVHAEEPAAEAVPEIPQELQDSPPELEPEPEGRSDPAAMPPEPAAEAAVGKTGALSDAGRGVWCWSSDRDGRVTALSPGASRAFGDKAGAMIGRSLEDVFAALDMAYHRSRLAESVQRRGPLRDVPVRIEEPGGGVRTWVLRAKARFSFPQGRFEGYMGEARPERLEDYPSAEPENAQVALARLTAAAGRLVSATEQDRFRPLRTDVLTVQRCGQLLGGLLSPGEPEPDADRRPPQPF